MNCGLIDISRPEGSHPVLQGMAALWVFSAAVSAMSVPGSRSGQWYQWLYRFAHLLAANLDRAGIFNVAQGSSPNLPTINR